MRNLIYLVALMLVCGLCWTTGFAANEGPVAWWKFERLIEERVEPLGEEDEEGVLEEEIEALEEEMAELEGEMVLTYGQDKVELQKELDDMRRELKELQNELNELRGGEPGEEAEHGEDEEADEEGALEEEIEILAEEIVELREEVEDAEGLDKEELQDELDGMLKDLRELLGELKELRQEDIEVLREEIAEVQAEMTQATGQEKEDLQNDLEEMSEELRERQEGLDKEVFLEAEEEVEVFMIRLVVDDAGDVEDRAEGAYVKIVPGAVGNAIQLDGNTSYVLRKPENAPELSGVFAVQAWIALGAYPTNWCPIIDHGSATNAGYFLGVDALGHAGFSIVAGGKQNQIQSAERIPLRKWTHIAGVYTPEDGIILYVDGKRVTAKKVNGEFTATQEAELLIGRHSIKRKPYGTLRPNATEAVYTFYDGLIDEVQVYDRRLTLDEISRYVSKTRPKSKPALSARTLPAGPPGPGRFAAYYTTLKYYDAWDAPWRVGEHADVVVRFDESACRFVFWRGTSYIPHWVTENGVWYDNEFNETWSDKGCHEPMSDKRCRHSHVRIIENSDARVVVHWRYALVDNWYSLAKVDELTGWGDWTDEVYTIYPDMVAVRKVTLHSSQPASPHEWHEAIIVMGPGQRPEQVLHPDALTLANMAGETHTYSWLHGAPGKDGLATEPKGANIHWVNTKSKYKPLVIVSPDSDPVFDIYAGELRRDVSMFPWWNHWPTAQKPSDGRYAMDSDLASHSSLSHCNWKPYAQTENSMTKIMLNGLTAKLAAGLVPLAKSWSISPQLKLKKGLLGTSFVGEGYNPTERAYQLVCKRRGKPSTLEFELACSKDSPAVNPAFVVKNWGEKGVALKIGGKKVTRGKDFRFGHRSTVDGSDLVVWIKTESAEPLTITLTPTKG
ncbi:MAG: hypothetical protein KAY65_00030 [Planctomycetes bacterium]|nr:hypothetical protein [Planctomycetota bacterium]